MLASSQPRGTPIQLRPAPTPAPIRVHIIGAVSKPGVYDLPVDSRVEDGVAIAGGFNEDASHESVNLAAELHDGAQVIVPTQKVVQNPTTSSTTTESQSPVIEAFPVNINTADQTELETLPGIGPVTASKILEYRQANGNFATIEEIQKVSGIGPATFEKLKDLITVGN